MFCSHSRCKENFLIYWTRLNSWLKLCISLSLRGKLKTQMNGRIGMWSCARSEESFTQKSDPRSSEMQKDITYAVLPESQPLTTRSSHHGSPVPNHRQFLLYHYYLILQSEGDRLYQHQKKRWFDCPKLNQISYPTLSVHYKLTGKADNIRTTDSAYHI